MRLVVIGGGAIGRACALAAARSKIEVTLIDRGVAGGEASVAAAGILGTQIEAKSDGPFLRLCLASRARYAAWVKEIEETSGVDTEMRASGSLRAAMDEADLATLERDIGWQAGAGLAIERIDAARARMIEPDLAPIAGGFFLPDEARIDPPSLLRALERAGQLSGVREVRAEVTCVETRSGRARGVKLADGRAIEADAVLLAAGSWSAKIEGTSLPPLSVRPARGQILELRCDPPLRTVIDAEHVYLSPRDDGRVLVGSTVELVGFEPAVTAEAAQRLLAEAIRVVPRLASARWSRAWAGLRPYTDDELPLLGKLAIDDLFIATGHFRNGILLSPITAAIAVAALTGSAMPADLRPFDPRRLIAAL